MSSPSIRWPGNDAPARILVLAVPRPNPRAAGRRHTPKGHVPVHPLVHRRPPPFAISWNLLHKHVYL
jgi:hypothetical protein